MQRIYHVFGRKGWNSPKGIQVVILILLSIFLLLYLIGPCVCIAPGMQQWAAASRWDGKDRWASIRGLTAWCSILLLLLGSAFTVAFHFAHPDLRSFQAYLTALGNSLFQALAPSASLPRWLMTLPLAPMLAVLMEHYAPLTQHRLSRVLLPLELAEVQQRQQEMAGAQKRKPSRVAAGGQSQTKKKRLRAQAQTEVQSSKRQRVLGQDQGTPSGDSEVLDPPAPQKQALPPTSSIDWSQVEE